MKRVHIFISGEVTGISFRSFIEKRANELNIKGWVRNIGEKVEAVFEGEEKKVDFLVKLCRSGPMFAKVKDLEVKEEEYEGEFRNFERTY